METDSPSVEKIALFQELFCGRRDVYARRWENTRTGEAGYVPAVKGGWGGRRGRPASDDYLALTDEVIAAHLRGEEAIGIFPLLPGDMCRLLAFDLDGPGWQLDALTLVEVGDRHGLRAAVERSRSGRGGHVWIFFSEPVAAATARRLGACLLRETMAVRGELDLTSYDRMFPSQDLLPKGGFGNLIAAPLHGGARSSNNTVFIDPRTGEAWDDQWAFLSKVERLPADSVHVLAEDLDPPAVWEDLVAGRRPTGSRPAPERVTAVQAAGIRVDKQGLPSWLLAEVKHLALHNPEFYRRQRMRLSTHNTPRFVRCYREDLTHLHLPRGLLADLDELLTESGSGLNMRDQRPQREPIEWRFDGELSGLQSRALDDVLSSELGVLVAPPGTGKTVMACAAIAARSQPTLVLVHRKHLVEHWRGQLTTLLNLDQEDVGLFGGGVDRRTGRVDVAMLQTLARRDHLSELFEGYGMIVADECHHIPAQTFEQVMWAATPRFVLGLTATPYRKDGLEGIIAMQCGPTRHRIDIEDTPAGRELSFELRVHTTELDVDDHAGPHIQDVLAAVAGDNTRTAQVCEDVTAAVRRGRRCLVLTERRDHLAALVDGLHQAGLVPHVLHGGASEEDRQAAVDAMAALGAGKGAAIVATGPYIGEGFDCPALDTLFVTFPVSFKGTIVQYIGRLLRLTDAKDTVEVHDYLDARIPVLRAMHSKRLRTYDKLGFVQS